MPPPIHTPPRQYKKAKADKLDLVGEDQRRMLEYRKQVGRRMGAWVVCGLIFGVVVGCDRLLFVDVCVAWL